MTTRTRDVGLGLGLAALAGLLLMWLIPHYVISPGQGALVLRPDFWPTILAWFLLAAGLGLAARARFGPDPIATDGGAGRSGESRSGENRSERAGWIRVAWLALVTVGLSLLIPTLGMVWASMLAGLVLLPALRPEHPLAAVIVALLLPLLLYAFFAKFAGVSVPPGTWTSQYVRLP